MYIATGFTDLRRGIDGLARIIRFQFHLNPYDKNILFLFCGRRTDRIKGLLWEGDGFLLLVYKRGYRKSIQQRHYAKLQEYNKKLEEYIEKVKICSPNRNSYSKSDHLETFMRIKTDYMGNDQLLPAYNVLVGVADEFISVFDVNQYRSDMDCFIPLMEQFYKTYGIYSQYPIADV